MTDASVPVSVARPPIAKSLEGVTAGVDVLVIGGGPAGCWAAISAAEAGASVLLVDKGYCGTSGATASAGVATWYVEPDADAREQAIASREALGGWLIDRRWMHRVLDETYAQMRRLGDWGYPFTRDPRGNHVRKSLQGPEYMRRMRKQVVRSRVRILDHSPALELLYNADGEVVGARGIRRHDGDGWTASAGAVVIATGGCAFLSGAIGCDVLTGDGHLMAAEAGAELSGMEFSNAYAISPTFSSVTKTAFYKFATFYTQDGVLEGAGSVRGRSVIAQTLLSEPVYARLDRAPAHIKADLRVEQPNFFVPFNREGIDPFTQLFPITLRLEGTVRGTGGLRVVDASCATTVPGLYAAGDAATRELICGGFTGGGSHNSAWAISSGVWAGAGAALHARARAGVKRRRAFRGSFSAGMESFAAAGIRPTGEADLELTAAEVTAAVQAEVHPYDRNYFRSEVVLVDSIGRLDDLWRRVRGGLRSGDQGAGALRARESAAMVAHARWMYASALQRSETRGMHKRTDHPGLDPAQQHRLLVGGVDQVWTGVDPQSPLTALELAA